MFHENHPLRFQSGSADKHVPEKLLVNGNLVCDQKALMSIWVSHFEVQGKSQVPSQGGGPESARYVRKVMIQKYWIPNLKLKKWSTL